MLLLDVGILIAFALFGLLSWHFQISYRVSILAGLMLLALAAVSVILGVELRDVVATLAFYALAIGVILAILEGWRGEDRAALGDLGRGPSGSFLSRMTRHFRRALETWKRRLSK